MAVLTGDIVGSTRLSADALQRARDVLADAARRTRKWSDGKVFGPDFYRGDAWQLVLENPRYCLRTAVWLKACLAASGGQVETRIAIGIGPAEEIHPRSVSRSIGEAFTLSGRALDDMGRRRDIELAIPDPGGEWGWLPSQAALCDFIVSRWTVSQAEVAVNFLEPRSPRSQHDVGKRLDRPQQSVSRVYRDGGVDVLLTVLKTVEAVPLDRLGRPGKPARRSTT